MAMPQGAIRRYFTLNDAVSTAIKNDGRIRAADERHKKNKRHSALKIIEALALVAAIPYVNSNVTEKDVQYYVRSKELYHAVNNHLGLPHVAAKTITHMFKLMCPHIGFPQGVLDSIVGQRNRNKPDNRGLFFGISRLFKVVQVPPQCAQASSVRDASSKRGLKDKDSLSQSQKRAKRTRRKLQRPVEVLSTATTALDQGSWKGMLAASDAAEPVSLVPKLAGNTTQTDHNSQVRTALFAPQGHHAHEALHAAVVREIEEKIQQGDTRVVAFCTELQIQWDAKKPPPPPPPPPPPARWTNWSILGLRWSELAGISCGWSCKSSWRTSQRLGRRKDRVRGTLL
jgi:hypothetical protein